MRLLAIITSTLLGFVLAMVGILIALHSEHTTVGILISFAGIFQCAYSLPQWRDDEL
jgi:uncharacterized membrane protein